jgi:hypothetical protein
MNDKRTGIFDQQRDAQKFDENREIDRTPRSHDDREHVARSSDAYIPPSVLPVPRDRDGWTHRWIRTAMLDVSDTTNVSRRFREGWEACNASEYAELMVQSDVGSRFEGNIEIGGLLLCKAPTEMVLKRNKYYEDMAQAQMATVERSYMNENDPRMPTMSVDNKSRTSFGRR